MTNSLQAEIVNAAGFSARMKIGLFRFFVILSAVLPIVSSVVVPVFVAPLPTQHSQLIFPESESIINVLMLLNLLLSVLVTIGLCMFWRWSRVAALVNIVTSLIMYSMFAYFVDSGLKVAVDQLATLLGGAVVCLAYFSSIAENFVKRTI